MICEEFGCLPSEAVRELEEDPERLVLTILQLRSYQRTMAEFDRLLAGDKHAAPRPGAMLRLVKHHTERFITESK